MNGRSNGWSTKPIKDKDCIRINVTNPNSIYIKTLIKFKGYRQFHVHSFVDTGASICVADRFIIPEEIWEDNPKPIEVRIADNSIRKISKVARNIKINISGEEFIIPTIYQQTTGVDLLLGNNFLQLYGPFVQYLDRIVIHKNNEEVICPKVQKAYRVASPKLLGELRKPRNRGGNIPKTNISLDKSDASPEVIEIQEVFRLQRIVDTILKTQDHVINRGSVDKALAQVTSENPLDPVINKLLKRVDIHALIELKDPGKVIRVKPMHYTPDDRNEFKVQIKELLDLKVIRPSKSPHSSPAFMVEKEAEKRRGKKRMVINYKALNKETLDDGYFLPKKEELFNMIRGKTWFSTFDCKSGFWQIPLKEQCRNLTAFSCPNGQFEWNVVPFGLKQAPGIFQRRMDDALGLKSNSELSKHCTVYVDDIIIFSDNEKDHYKHILMLLETCLKEGIILSSKKAVVAQKQIKFLGLEIESGKIKMQPHVLVKLKDFPSKITDKTQLQRLLGILNYLEGYIKNLAKMRSPLQAKLKKDVTFHWNDSDTAYVDKIKKQCSVLPELYHPLDEDDMILETDASGSHWGAVLKAKPSDGIERLCRYTSGTFKSAELNYHSNEKEFLAVKRGIDKFKIYLISKPFLVRTDNTQFAHFLRVDIKGDYKQGRLLRWQQWFNYYKFNVEHIKGSSNSLADCLTREFKPLEQ